MHRKGFNHGFTVFVFAVLGFLSCKNTAEETSFEVAIRLPNEPESLHPIFSKSTYAAPIEGLILMPLTEFDPVTLELSPLLITSIPVGEKVTSGKHANGKVFRFAFRPEAVWADGKPVTGNDYVFTFKSVYNPHVNARSWRSFMDFVSEIEVDAADPKKVSVYLDSTYMLDVQATTNFNIYPAHIYDPKNIMAGFTLEELRDPAKTWTADQDSLLKEFATNYESAVYFRETVVGNGPYILDQWVTGEFIRLTRNQNWWGDQLKDPPLLLQAYPSAITYKFILDATAAEAALKAGEIDLMAEVPVNAFKAMEGDAQWKEKLQFVTPEQMQVNYLELNTRDSILADARIRKALALTIDYDGILNNILQGLAERTTGPIYPKKRYFDKSLQPLKQDINTALALIKDAGWTDTNGNGTPDKMIGGKRTELHLEIKTTNKEEGLATSNIVKENAAKAGFDIEIVIVDPSQLQQDIKQNNFTIIPIRVNAFPEDYDPYVLWHSDNDHEGGTNRTGFHTPELDQIIDELRTTEDEARKDELYKAFQKIIYEQQPSIYLYVPKQRIIASKRVELLTSPRRPGYFENLLKPAGQ